MVKTIRICSCLVGALLSAGSASPPAMAEVAQLRFPYLTSSEAKFPRYRQVAEQASASYVKVTLTTKPKGWNDQPGVLHTGSGVVLSRTGLILTAAHIARGKRFSTQITLRNGTRFVGRILAVSPKQELALIQTPPLPGTRPIRFATSAKLKKRDWLMAIGSPKRRWGIVTLGFVRIPNIGERLDYGQWGFANAIEARMEVESGHSGGPVVNRQGDLVGMVAGYELGDTTKTPYVSPRITYIVPSDDILRWLKARNITVRGARP